MRTNTHRRYRWTLQNVSADCYGFTGTDMAFHPSEMPARTTESGPAWDAATSLFCRRSAATFSYAYVSGGVVKFRTRYNT